MNIKAIVTIDTPGGYTSKIALRNILKQGITIGPILYIVDTDKIIKIGERCYTTYRQEIRINHVLYS